MRAQKIRFGALTCVVCVFTATAACSLSGLDEYLSGSATSDAGSASSGVTSGAGGASNAAASASGSGAPVGSGGACAGKVCGSTCVADPSTDANNCGGCSVTCATGYACTEGICGNVPREVTAAGLRTCVVLHGGEVWCWGRNNWGQSGMLPGAPGTFTTPFLTTNCVPTPTRIAGLTDVVQVALASAATCARTSKGRVWCWGSNVEGALGHTPSVTMGDQKCTRLGLESPSDPTTTKVGFCSPQPLEVQLPSGVSAAQIRAGNKLMCILSTDGDVHCWGRNGEGEISAPPSAAAPIPTPTKNANVNLDAADLSVSGTNTEGATVCVVRKTSNTVACWGSSGAPNGVPGLFPSPSVSGCLPMDPCDPIAHPVPLIFESLAGSVFADSVHPGYLTACSLGNHLVQCWGNNLFALRGDGTAGDIHFNPSPVSSLPPIDALAMNFGTAAALDETGALWAWGYNADGQIGDGTLTGDHTCNVNNSSPCASKPKKIASNIASVSMGSTNGAAITTAGKVLIWGSNYTCELGHQPAKAEGDKDHDGLFCNPTPKEVVGLP